MPKDRGKVIAEKRKRRRARLLKKKHRQHINIATTVEPIISSGFDKSAFQNAASIINSIPNRVGFDKSAWINHGQ